MKWRNKLRWLVHADKWHVPKRQREHYRIIFDRTLKKLGVAPNIFNGDDLNSKIKWLMLFDQGPDIVRCSDKLAVRGYVRNTIGKRYLNTIYGIWSHSEDIDFDCLPSSFVLKANHDSGSVWVVNDKSSVDLEKIRKQVAGSLGNRYYGVNKGEWFYQHITPKVFAEEFIQNDCGDLPDFKFHCSSGRVLFLQYIYDRKKERIREQVIDVDGRSTLPGLDHEFFEGTKFAQPQQWLALLEIASLLSMGFKYVRVDLYIVNGSIRFGEMTFSPKNGNYLSNGQRILGARLALNRDTQRPPFPE